MFVCKQNFKAANPISGPNFSELGTLEWDTVDPDCLIRITNVDTYDFLLNPLFFLDKLKKNQKTFFFKFPSLFCILIILILNGAQNFKFIGFVFATLFGWILYTFQDTSTRSELVTLEWWISGLMLDRLFFLISRLNIACCPHEFNLQINRSGLRISHSKVFSSG